MIIEIDDECIVVNVPSEEHQEAIRKLKKEGVTFHIATRDGNIFEKDIIYKAKFRRNILAKHLYGIKDGELYPVYKDYDAGNLSYENIYFSKRDPYKNEQYYQRYIDFDALKPVHPHSSETPAIPICLVPSGKLVPDQSIQWTTAYNKNKEYQCIMKEDMIVFRTAAYDLNNIESREKAKKAIKVFLFNE